MRKMFIYISLVILLLSACGTVNTATPNKFEERNKPNLQPYEIHGVFFDKPLKVIGIGDSLTEGIGDERQQNGYFGRMLKSMEDWQGVSEVHGENLAKKGRRSDELLLLLDNSAIQEEIKHADIIMLTIGGNDLMKIIKRDLFKLRQKPFYDELTVFSKRLTGIFNEMRNINSDAVIIVGGLYNPFTIITDEAPEMQNIIRDWNKEIEDKVVKDGKACFVPVNDLFYSNENLVYHTDFFHPNAKGYEQITERYLQAIKKCDLKKLSDGNFDMK